MAEIHSEDEKAQEMERKKALLVYKSNQHSASDDDDEEDDEEEEEEEENGHERHEQEETASVEDDEEDARSVHSEAVSVEEEEEELHDEEDDDDMEEDMEVDEDEVQVEKDDDESVNAPSDDDLDSTATPRHDTEDDDDDDVAEEDDTEDSATESKASQPLDDSQTSSGASKPTASAGGASSSGSKLNVEEIIAARRRTGARKECEVCHEGRNGRRAMLCASCKTMYHSSCYRKKYSKLITAMGKQWFCPDCEPVKPASPEKGSESATPRKKKGSAHDESRVSSKQLSAKELKNARGLKSAVSSKSHRDSSSAVYTAASLPGDVLVVSGVSGANLLDQELKRVTEIAMRSGRKVNALIVERTEEMLFVTQSMTAEIEDVLGSAKTKAPQSSRSILHHDEASSGTGPLPPLSALTMVSSSDGAGGIHNAQANSRELEARDTVLRSLHEGLYSLKNMLEQLQVMGIQSEVDLIRDIKVPPVKEEPKPTTTGTTTTARKSTSGAAAARTAAALSAAAKREAKPGASRLYSAKQIQKLEEWYQKSSRPEASEIQAMYRIINSPEYADKELQPDGISVKQIRIWFDNRRAKERLDYMRLKMKDISTADMDAEDVKRMKAAYIDEAKEVLEARVSRLKENGKTVPLIDEADTLLLQSSERPLPMSKSTKASPASKTGGGLASFSSKDEKSSSINQKKRIRIDYVASVRKAVKDARDAGKSEDEIKLIKTAAIERARERLHVPYKNARLGPTKPLGKEEVTHIKMTMLKLLEEDAPAEELTDVVELLLSVIIPHDTLVESQLHRQLGLVLKAHKDNKELVKQTNKLLDEFNTIIEKGDDATLYDDEASVSGLAIGDEDKAKSKKKPKKDSTNLLLSVDSESLPGTPGASPDSPGASPDARKARVKFSRDQLMKLERHFHKEDTPSKKNLEKLSKKLNDIAARDAACEGQDRIDYKQIRSWFYKRRSTNQPPQALSQADLREIELAGTASSSSSASETESDSNDEAPAATPTRKPTSKSTKEKSAAPKRKVSEDKPAAASKRQKKTDGTPSETKTPARVSKKEAAASASAAAGASAAAAAAGKQHSGRIFNVKQLATIIEEYEKNPRPTVERLEELQRILNQDDHADDNFVNPLGVTKRQIKTWFSNRRAKERLEVIRMKVQTTDGSAKGKGSSKLKKVAQNESGASGSDDDGDDDDDDDDDQPIKKPTKAAVSAPHSAKKELFTGSSDTAGSRHMSDDDLSDDNDDDDDDDVDMGSDDDDDVEKDSDDDNEKDSDDDDDDDDDDSDDDVDDTED